MLGVLVVGGLMFAGAFSGRSSEAAQAVVAPPPKLQLLASTTGGVPQLATTVAGQPPLHIFTGPPARVHRGAAPSAEPGYALALTRQPNGRWASVLHGSAEMPEGGALTVTLVVPWAELSHRYSAVNLVVR